MPTRDAEKEEIEKTYEELDKLISMFKVEENLIVLGDLNEGVEEGEDGNSVGKFGLGGKDKRRKIVEFCYQYNMITANHLCQHRKRRHSVYMDSIRSQRLISDRLHPNQVKVQESE